MSDITIKPPKIGKPTDTPADLIYTPDRAPDLDPSEVSFWDTDFSGAMSRGFYYDTTQAYVGGAQPDLRARLGLDTPMSREDWEASPYYRSGVKWDQAWTVERARSIADAQDQAHEDAYQFDRMTTGGFAGNLTGRLIGSLADPVNAIGVPWAMGRGLLGAAARGAAGALAAESIALPIHAYANISNQIPFTGNDAAIELAFAAGGGAVLGTAGEAVARALKGRPGAPRPSVGTETPPTPSARPDAALDAPHVVAEPVSVVPRADGTLAPITAPVADAAPIHGTTTPEPRPVGTTGTAGTVVADVAAAPKRVVFTVPESEFAGKSLAEIADTSGGRTLTVDKETGEILKVVEEPSVWTPKNDDIAKRVEPILASERQKRDSEIFVNDKARAQKKRATRSDDRVNADAVAEVNTAVERMLKERAERLGRDPLAMDGEPVPGVLVARRHPDHIGELKEIPVEEWWRSNVIAEAIYRKKIGTDPRLSGQTPHLTATPDNMTPAQSPLFLDHVKDSLRVLSKDQFDELARKSMGGEWLPNLDKHLGGTGEGSREQLAENVWAAIHGQKAQEVRGGVFVGTEPPKNLGAHEVIKITEGNKVEGSELAVAQHADSIQAAMEGKEAVRLKLDDGEHVTVKAEDLPKVLDGIKERTGVAQMGRTLAGDPPSPRVASAADDLARRIDQATAERWQAVKTELEKGNTEAAVAKALEGTGYSVKTPEEFMRLANGIADQEVKAMAVNTAHELSATREALKAAVACLLGGV